MAIGQSIKYLVVIPWTIKSTVFYANNNFKDGHYRENNDLYIFIAALLRPPATIQVHDLIFNHLPFYIDVRKNHVEQLTNDEAAQLSELKTKIKKNVIKNLLIVLREKKTAVNENVPKFQNFIEGVINQSMISEKKYITKFNTDDNIEIQKRDRESKGRIIDNL